MAVAKRVDETPLGYQFVDGAKVWEQHATHGFPIELSIPLLAMKGYLPTWEELYRAAMKDGMQPETLTDRLIPIVEDAYASHPDVVRELRVRLKLMPTYLSIKPVSKADENQGGRR